MQIVIDIPEYIYKLCQGHGDIVYKYIGKGKPLPKGHGRLIDENELIDEIVCEEIDGRYYSVLYAHSIYDASTIIEADK